MKPTVPPEPEPCRPGCQMVDEGMGGPSVHHHRAGCPNGPWTQFIRGQASAAAAVPPEPAPPTLDPATLYRQALEALINGVEYGLKRYAEAGDGLLAAALERAHDAIALIVAACDACDGRGQEDGCKSCGMWRSPAAPPTVAPARTAREVAYELAGDLGCLVNRVAKPGSSVRIITEAIERDRASRSPAATDDAVDFALCMAARTYVESAGWIRCVHCRGLVKRAGELATCEPPCLGYFAREALAVYRSALRGQEGRLRPGSEAAGKVHGAPLSGLDAATVEAAAKAVETALKDAYRRKSTLENAPRIDDATWQYMSGTVSGLNAALAVVRDLATPPRCKNAWCGKVSTDDALSLGCGKCFATGWPGSRAYCSEECRALATPPGQTKP